MDKAHLKRLMSEKGCLPDNLTCEALFGRLKNEMFYYRIGGILVFVKGLSIVLCN